MNKSIKYTLTYKGRKMQALVSFLAGMDPIPNFLIRAAVETGLDVEHYREGKAALWLDKLRQEFDKNDHGYGPSIRYLICKILVKITVPEAEEKPEEIPSGQELVFQERQRIRRDQAILAAFKDETEFKETLEKLAENIKMYEKDIEHNLESLEVLSKLVDRVNMWRGVNNHAATMKIPGILGNGINAIATVGSGVAGGLMTYGAAPALQAIVKGGALVGQYLAETELSEHRSVYKEELKVARLQYIAADIQFLQDCVIPIVQQKFSKESPAEQYLQGLIKYMQSLMKVNYAQEVYKKNAHIGAGLSEINNTGELIDDIRILLEISDNKTALTQQNRTYSHIQKNIVSAKNGLSKEIKAHQLTLDSLQKRLKQEQGELARIRSEPTSPGPAAPIGSELIPAKVLQQHTVQDNIDKLTQQIRAVEHEIEICESSEKILTEKHQLLNLKINAVESMMQAIKQTPKEEKSLPVTEPALTPQLVIADFEDEDAEEEVKYFQGSLWLRCQYEQRQLIRVIEDYPLSSHLVGKEIKESQVHKAQGAFLNLYKEINKVDLRLNHGLENLNQQYKKLSELMAKKEFKGNLEKHIVEFSNFQHISATILQDINALQENELLNPKNARINQYQAKLEVAKQQFEIFAKHTSVRKELLADPAAQAAVNRLADSFKNLDVPAVIEKSDFSSSQSAGMQDPLKHPKTNFLIGKRLITLENQLATLAKKTDEKLKSAEIDSVIEDFKTLKKNCDSFKDIAHLKNLDKRAVNFIHHRYEIFINRGLKLIEKLSSHDHGKPLPASTQKSLKMLQAQFKEAPVSKLKITVEPRQKESITSPKTHVDWHSASTPKSPLSTATEIPSISLADKVNFLSPKPAKTRQRSAELTPEPQLALSN